MTARTLVFVVKKQKEGSEVLMKAGVCQDQVCILSVTVCVAEDGIEPEREVGSTGLP